MLKTLLASVALGLSFAAAAANPQVEIRTNMGAIVLELEPEKAPKTVENFLHYVKDGHYNGTIFHRVIPGFMIQGGGFAQDMREKPTRAPIENEAKNRLSNARGSVAMARTGAPHSATAQFYINLADNSSLDYPGRDGWGYTVFGRVVKGMDVVDQIATVRTGTAGHHSDVPLKPVVIQHAQIMRGGASGK